MASAKNNPQYQLDLANLAGEPEEGWELHTYDEGGTPDSLHHGNLFDQDEDEAGERFDPITGKKIDNSTYTGMESLNVVGPDSLGRDGDILPDLDEHDAAAQWLAEHETVVVPVPLTEIGSHEIVTAA